MQQLIFLELNEVMVPYVEHYVAKGRLPHFAALLHQVGYRRTFAEESYAHLEPWIQWVSARTGLPFARHKVFRLGDIVGAPVRQIFEVLEEHGVSVGALSPMNAENRLKNPAFFVPDPWTGGTVSAKADVKRLFRALSNSVNQNASQNHSASDIIFLVEGLLRYASLGNAERYVRLAVGSIGKPWRRAMFLDLLLTDLFIRLWEENKPQFSLLFLNGAAHVQHHYLYASQSYAGPHHNPDWYVQPGIDPLFEIYALYDRILGQLLALQPKPRVVLATGLSQEPYPSPVYYYRLKNHARFLKQIDVSYVDVKPRMSRDFLVECTSEEAAKEAEDILASIRDFKGVHVFDIDNRGASLFVSLTFPDEITADTCMHFLHGKLPNFAQHVAFVALKNGHHVAQGYIIDSEKTAVTKALVPVTTVYDDVLEHFGIVGSTMALLQETESLLGRRKNLLDKRGAAAA